MDTSLLGRAVIQIILFLLCLTVHEAAHALVAFWKGDDTAKRLDRLSLNPMVHIDLFGTILIPLFGALSNFPVFGWAKPVPVDARNLKHPVQDMMWISFAGPLSNFLFAVVVVILFNIFFAIFNDLPTSFHRPVYFIAYSMVFINCILGLFNMLPIAPLDGWKVLMGVLPGDIREKLEPFERYGMVALILLMFSGLFQYLAVFPKWLTDRLFAIGFSIFL